MGKKKKVDTRSKRDIIIETIEAGGATMESLTKAADCKYASIMSNFSMLRLMGQCPVKDVEVTVTDDEGNKTTELTYRLVSNEEWETVKAEKSEKSKAKKAPARSPEEMEEIINKRIDKAHKALNMATNRASVNAESEILQLRADKAAIELKIAELELEELKG